MGTGRADSWFGSGMYLVLVLVVVLLVNPDADVGNSKTQCEHDQSLENTVDEVHIRGHVLIIPQNGSVGLSEASIYDSGVVDLT